LVGWKKIVLTTAGFGGGFAVLLAVLIGGVLWYQGRPQIEREWNTAAIKATFKDLRVTTSTPKPKFIFSYSLENTTDFDYSIDDKSQVLVMATLPEGKGLEPSESLSLSPTVYIPAKQKVVLSVFKEGEYNEAYPERDRDNLEKLAPYMGKQLKKLDGFVLFDKTRRYKIILPNGWPDAKQTETGKQ
jgi:hypothetical protein